MTEWIRQYIDPWISVGIEYLRDTQMFQRPVPTLTPASHDADWTLGHHAVAVPLGIGVVYRVLPVLSIDPSFRYAIPGWRRRVRKADRIGVYP